MNMITERALSAPINLESAENFSGAIVLGSHAIFFAKGTGTLPVKPELEERIVQLSGGVRTFYSANARTTKSYLMIDDQEVALSACPTSDRFSIDMRMFTSSNRVIELDPGLCAIIAPTNWGKSTVLYRGLIPSMQSTKDVTAVRRINFVEIFEGEQPYTYDRYTSLEEALMQEMLNALLAGGTILSVDSLRPFIYAKSVGGTGTAGLDQYLSIQLTALSNIFAACGSMLIATINPLVTRDDEKSRNRYDEIVTQLVAGTTCAIVGEEARAGQIYPRGFSNPDRSPIPMTISDLSDKTMRERGEMALRAIADREPQETIVVVDMDADSSVQTAARLVRSAQVMRDLDANK